MPPTAGGPAGSGAAARTTPAQWARTLARGTVPGTLHLPRTTRGEGEHLPGAATGRGARRGETRTESLPVTHLTDAHGDLLLLLERGAALHERLQELGAQAGDLGVPVVLDVLDVPPGQASLPRARLTVTGWVLPVPAADERRVAQAAASARPLGALLDVGRTQQLWRLEVGEVRVTTPQGVHVVGDEEVTTATPDPLYETEDVVVAHLETHHGDELVGWVLRTLPLEAARAVREVSVVGADRHGLDVLCTIGASTTVLRAAFDIPVRGEEELPAALCRLFDCPCARHESLAGAHR
ncbi:DUF2470 domain-containing protein [Kineococcus rubinsiae]|uniref:DUF2470 domain-containing protein n=1 Tax=Kineococcus rubinsiae TaxID=2609562 RepID=UPI0014315D94|nr:DUF2470 domain-containing protein [Kineococcus rubinsiae]NIZ91314.1 DUF2470 domain-containing protein [Kineococcus rubinsiae]